MIIADKIIDERKRNGWSQEELADKLQVSRQSVSKWEGAQSIPDINRIIQMAELFGVSTDYLLKDDASRGNEVIPVMEAEEGKGRIHKVSMEEASEYLRIQKHYAPVVALGVSLCILSPVLLIVLAGLSDSNLFGISENLAAGLGVVTLLVMIAIAVYVFINYGSKVSKYEFLEQEEIDTAYGVDGMVKEKKNAYEATFNRCIGIGVVMCVLCAFADRRISGSRGLHHLCDGRRAAGDHQCCGESVRPGRNGYGQLSVSAPGGRLHRFQEKKKSGNPESGGNLLAAGNSTLPGDLPSHRQLEYELDPLANRRCAFCSGDDDHQYDRKRVTGKVFLCEYCFDVFRMIQ